MMRINLAQTLDREALAPMPEEVIATIKILESAGVNTLPGKNKAELDAWCRELGPHLGPGLRIFAAEFETGTKPVPGDWIRLEAHKACIDLHICLEGQERMAVGPQGQFSQREPYNEADDVEFGICAISSCQDLGVLDALVLMPEDGHMPKFSPQKPALVRKLVVKIPINT